MLDEIVAATRRRLPAVLDRQAGFESLAADMPPASSFRNALRSDGISVIAEVKRRSPSRGDLDPELNPVAQAVRYAAGGAAAVSVLTEPEYFSGSPDDLATVAATLSVPVLRKDFIVHPAQIWEARGLGASAVLLIVAALGREELGGLLEVCRQAGVDALVEVHDADEVAVALAAGAEIVGVNNRNLADFTVDLATSEHLAPLLADVAVTVSESGISTAADAARMRAAGFNAVLVGEALVRSPDPAALVRELRGDGGGEW
ncbi:MAG TPA: indole-3-glycerol phosphate synthase TrpC [Acidimicrobiia bacterium]|nr:indole-3-glycerol phosphate synthase TrpC [Acidimicrobiia bacterium]